MMAVLVEILQAGHDGDERDQVHHHGNDVEGFDPLQPGRRIGAEEIGFCNQVKHNEVNGGHLAGGFPFCGHAGHHRLVLVLRISAQQRDENVARRNRSHHPHRDVLIEREREEGRQGENLVCQRIPKRAPRRHVAGFAGEVAVIPVRQYRDQKGQ